MKTKNFYKSFILDIIFVVGIMALFMFVRLEAQNNLAQIKDYIPEVTKLQTDLSKSKGEETATWNFQG